MIINEIIRKYEDFADATILEFNFKYGASLNLDKKGTIEVVILCMNSAKDYQYEVIKLIFSRVIQFRFIEHAKTSSAVIESALINQKQGYVVVDFFPFIEGDGSLTENEFSDFKIESEVISYEFINEYDS